MKKNSIIKFLFENKDETYAKFQCKLIPNIKPDSIIGVRTPVLRKYADKLFKTNDFNLDDFLNDLPHRYFEENQIHSFILSKYKDFDILIKKIYDFLPYVDNWATCDMMSFDIIKNNKNEIIPHAYIWLKSNRVYEIRFGILIFMRYFLDGDFKHEYLQEIIKIKNNDYYVRMAIAWYLSTALSKQYDFAVKCLENQCLDKWTHNKTIQKAIESYRIDDNIKSYLKTLRLRDNKK